MFKKLVDFVFGTPKKATPAPASPAVAASQWTEAKNLADTLKEVAAQKEAVVEIETTPTVAPTPTKKKRTYVKRERAVEPIAAWPFPIEKPSEGVTLAELEALKVEPVKPAAMKVRKSRKAASVPKQG